MVSDIHEGLGKRPPRVRRDSCSKAVPPPQTEPISSQNAQEKARGNICICFQTPWESARGRMEVCESLEGSNQGKTILHGIQFGPFILKQRRL